MARGKVLGGPNGRMLPPTGNGPIEVTRDSIDASLDIDVPDQSPTPGPEAMNEASEQRSDPEGRTGSDEVTVPPGPELAARIENPLPATVDSMLMERLPEQGEPEEIIVACEKRLYAANLLLESRSKSALEEYYSHAAPAVQLAWATESWRQAVDPATGKTCRSWSAWLKLVKVSRQHAYRMTKERPLLEALKPLGVEKVTTTQIDALTPVLNGFGADGVRKLWFTAEEIGSVSAPTLLRLRAQLELNPVGKQVSEGEEEVQRSEVLRFQVKAGAFDPDRVREVARAQPEIALLVARAILAELGEVAPEVTEA